MSTLKTVYKNYSKKYLQFSGANNNNKSIIAIVVILIGVGLLIPGLRAADYNNWCNTGANWNRWNYTNDNTKYNDYCKKYSAKGTIFTYEYKKNNESEKNDKKASDKKASDSTVIILSPIDTLRKAIKNNEFKEKTAFDNNDYLNRLINKDKTIRDGLLTEIMIERWVGFTLIFVSIIFLLSKHTLIFKLNNT
jgi:hypothetical protein